MIHHGMTATHYVLNGHDNGFCLIVVRNRKNVQWLFLVMVGERLCADLRHRRHIMRAAMNMSITINHVPLTRIDFYRKEIGRSQSSFTVRAAE